MRAMVPGVVLALAVVSAAVGQEQGRPGAVRRLPGGQVVRSAPGDSGSMRGGRGGVRPVMPVTADSLMAEMQRKTDVPAVDLSGEWTGILCENERVLLAEVTLTARDSGKRRYTGSLHFVIVPPDQSQRRGPVVQGGEGGWDVTAAEDPGSGAVMIEGLGWATGAARVPGVQPVTLRGVYAGKEREIAGQAWAAGGYGPTEPYFVMARGGAGEAGGGAIKAFAQHAADAALTLVAAAGDVPAQAAVEKWAAEYDAEYPRSAQQDPLDKVAVQGLRLLRDEAFKPVFGGSYDTMDDGQLGLAMKGVGGAVQSAPAAGRGRIVMPEGLTSRDPAERQKAAQELQAQMEAQRAEQAGAVRGRGSDPNAALEAAQNRAREQQAALAFKQKYMHLPYILKPSASRMAAVAAMRLIDSWEAQELARFGKETPVGSTFDDMAATETVLAERAVYAWPSEKQGWKATFGGLRTKLAGPALAASVEARTREAQGLEGARMLASWEAASAEMLKRAPEADRTAAVQRVNAKLDGLLEELLAKPRAEMAAFHSGSAAIRDGALWYAGLIEEFGFATSRPPVQKALAELHAEREKVLSATSGDFEKAISASTSVAALNALMQANFAVPGDRQLKGYPAIAAAIQKREMELDQAHAMSLFSPGEQKLMDKPGHVDVAKGKDMKPDGDDVRMAILRMYKEMNGTIQDAHTVRVNTRLTNFPLVPFAAVIKIDEVKLVSVKAGKDPGEFDCVYHADEQCDIPDDNALNIDPNMREGLTDAARMENSALKDTADEDKTITVRLTEEGWRVPGSEGIGDFEMSMDRMMKLMTH
ncbi:MAG TPA: hypothetical protein VH253_06495 [Phycisphaerae bacterium]|nr:hypothetical protein [Phycisphaerae bacterium]